MDKHSKKPLLWFNASEHINAERRNKTFQNKIMDDPGYTPSQNRYGWRARAIGGPAPKEPRS